MTRGGSTTVVGQDFFRNALPQDRFNSEQLPFTRGPNAMLFGLGKAAGAFVSSSTRAKKTDRRTCETPMDSRGGHRTTRDDNRVLRKNLRSLRSAGVSEGLNRFRLYPTDDQRRHFFTQLATPLRTTTLRLNDETGHLPRNALRPWPDYDAVSPWRATGAPLIATSPNVAASQPAGTQDFAQAGLTSTEFSAGGTPVPTQRFSPLPVHPHLQILKSGEVSAPPSAYARPTSHIRLASPSAFPLRPFP